MWDVGCAFLRLLPSSKAGSARPSFFVGSPPRPPPPTSRVCAPLVQAAAAPAVEPVGALAEWFGKLLLADSGVLYEDPFLQIGVKQQYAGPQGRLLLFFGNKHTAPLTALHATITAPPGLRLTAGAPPDTLPPRAQLQVRRTAAPARSRLVAVRATGQPRPACVWCSGGTAGPTADVAAPSVCPDGDRVRVRGPLPRARVPGAVVPHRHAARRRAAGPARRAVQVPAARARHGRLLLRQVEAVPQPAQPDPGDREPAPPQARRLSLCLHSWGSGLTCWWPSRTSWPSPTPSGPVRTLLGVAVLLLLRKSVPRRFPVPVAPSSDASGPGTRVQVRNVKPIGLQGIAAAFIALKIGLAQGLVSGLAALLPC